MDVILNQEVLGRHIISRSSNVPTASDSIRAGAKLSCLIVPTALKIIADTNAKKNNYLNVSTAEFLIKQHLTTAELEPIC